MQPSPQRSSLRISRAPAAISELGSNASALSGPATVCEQIEAEIKIVLAGLD